MCITGYFLACVPHVCSADGDQKRAPDSLGLMLEMAVNCHVGVGS